MLNCLLCPRELRRGWCRCVRDRDHHHMDVEGNTDLSSSLIKQRTVAEAQNSLFSVATWVDRDAEERWHGLHWEHLPPAREGIPAGLVLGAPSEIGEILCCKPVSPLSLFIYDLMVKKTRLGLRRCSFSSWLCHKLLVWPLESYLTCGSQVPHLHVGCPNSSLHSWGVGKTHHED